MLADQHSLVVRKVPNVGVGPLWIQVHAAQNQSQGILIRQLFAFIRDPAKMPCFIGSPELLGTQERIYIVVWRLGVTPLVDASRRDQEFRGVLVGRRPGRSTAGPSLYRRRRRGLARYRTAIPSEDLQHLLSFRRIG